VFAPDIVFEMGEMARRATLSVMTSLMRGTVGDIVATGQDATLIRRTCNALACG
jgi:hypothetical protein